jgi:hypothetical protein
MVPMLALLAWLLKESADHALQARRDATRHHVEVVQGILAWAQAREKDGSRTREQGAGVGQVGVAPQEIDRMTQQNAARVEQTAAASTAMKEPAIALAGEVSPFRLTDGPAEDRRRRAAPVSRKPATVRRDENEYIVRRSSPANSMKRRRCR